MIRRSTLSLTRSLRPSGIRPFSHSSILPKRKAQSNLDPTGRTPGFARRISQHDASTQRDASKASATPPDLSLSSTPSQSTDKVADALKASTASNDNALLAPVSIPSDPHGVLREDHPATSILAQSSIVVQRQLEMMNVLLGFEQANRYVLMDSTGNHIGFLAERDHGMGNMMARQMLSTHRSFTTHVFDKNEKEILRFHRPFAWISSRIKVYDAVHPDVTAYSTSTALQGTSAGSITSDTSAQISQLDVSEMRVIGEAQQEWAPLRRKYNLFCHRPLSEGDPDAPQLTSGDLPLSNSTALQTTSDGQTHGFAQFAHVNEPWLSWDFSLMSETGGLIGSVNRNFAGFAREIFTDTGVYALRMDAAGLSAEPGHLISQTGKQGQLQTQEEGEGQRTGMTLDQRAVMLATAVSIDFDYFSRHSGHGGGVGFMPIWFPWGSGGGAAAGEAGAGAEAGGAVGGAGRAAGGVGAGEGAMTGAGTMAGYEAMQRGRESQQQQADDASPTSNTTDEPFLNDEPSSKDDHDDHDDYWGGGGGGGGDTGADAGSEGGDGEGGGWGDLLSDVFGD